MNVSKQAKKPIPTNCHPVHVIGSLSASSKNVCFALSQTRVAEIALIITRTTTYLLRETKTN